MKNELLKTEQLENEISVIEQSHKSAILSIHENMQQLVNDCISIEVDEDDKEKYETALELKRVVKATHVAIEKKRKELKQPLIDYGKRLDRWVEEIYTPLVNAEKIVKKKMEIYEAKQEKLKQERKLIEEQEQQKEIELDYRLKELNSQLEKINLAKSKSELNEIQNYLDGIDISSFGKKSSEAGFILNQLKLTCSMACRVVGDNEIIESPKIEATPITEDLLAGFKESIPEPAKLVVIENEVENSSEKKEEVQEVLVKNEDGIFEQIEVPISQRNKASDEDVIKMIDNVSNNVLSDVVKMIDDRTKSLIENAEFFDLKDFSEYKSVIFQEVRIRVSVLLKSNQ